MKAQYKKRDTLAWVIIIALSAVYFAFNRALYKGFLDINDMHFAGLTFHLGQLHRFVFAGIQWMVLLWYLQVYVAQEQLKTLTWFVAGLFVLDAALIPLVKSGIAKPIPYYLHGMFHKAIKYMASGLFAVMATVFIKFIKKSTPMNPKEIKVKQEITEENKTKHTPIPQWWRWLFRIAYVFSVILCTYLLFTNHFKWSGIVYLCGLTGIGFQLKWKRRRFKKISPILILLGLSITWIYGLYGVWEDFFTGGVYFLSGFFILITTRNSKNETLFRGLNTAIILLFSLAAWFMYFFFDVFR